MFLNEIAQRHMHESFDGYDAVTEDFVEDSFTARIDLTDRFLSIYNRPTRKRQLYMKPGTLLPTSYVIRHSTTKDVYIVGQIRQDARYDVEGGDPYVAMAMLHLVTPLAQGSSGVAIQTRKVTVGPQDDPGWMVEQQIDKTYLDIEFRTSSAEEGVYESKVENFYAWTPITVTAQQWDFFTLNDAVYRVVDTFTDIGMRGLRLDRAVDPRIDVVIYTNARVYDEVEHEFVDNQRPYNVTAIVPADVNIATWDDSNAASQISLVIDFGNIGFVPKQNQEISYQGRTRIIRSVATQAGEKQYRIECE